MGKYHKDTARESPLCVVADVVSFQVLVGAGYYCLLIHITNPPLRFFPGITEQKELSWLSLYFPPPAVISLSGDEVGDYVAEADVTAGEESDETHQEQESVLD